MVAQIEANIPVPFCFGKDCAFSGIWNKHGSTFSRNCLIKKCLARWDTHFLFPPPIMAPALHTLTAKAEAYPRSRIIMPSSPARHAALSFRCRHCVHRSLRNPRQAGSLPAKPILTAFPPLHIFAPMKNCLLLSLEAAA